MKSLQAYISNIDPQLLQHVTGKMGDFVRAFQSQHFVSEAAFIKYICGEKYTKRYYDNLKYRTKKILQDHLQFPWLEFLAFENDGEAGVIIYKRDRVKKLPSANILYVSDDELFQRCWPALRTHLLFRHGFVTSKIERRLLSRTAGFELRKIEGGQKFFLSKELQENDIKYIYSELVALDV